MDSSKNRMCSHRLLPCHFHLLEKVSIKLSKREWLEWLFARSDKFLIQSNRKQLTGFYGSDYSLYEVAIQWIIDTYSHKWLPEYDAWNDFVLTSLLSQQLHAYSWIYYRPINNYDELPLGLRWQPRVPGSHAVEKTEVLIWILRGHRSSQDDSGIPNTLGGRL